MTEQPSLENIMRRNRLRWHDHANRMESDHAEPSLIKKMMFSHFAADKRPCNAGVRKRWEDKIMEDLAKSDIRNWRRDTKDRNKWRGLINTHATHRSPQQNIYETVHQYKISAETRRAEETAKASGKGARKITEVLMKNVNNTYACPNCQRTFKAQGITGHVRSCAAAWCKQNNIKRRNKV